MPSKKPEISIILTHYKAKKELFACLRSIKKYSSNTAHEIIVVDNDEESPIGKELLKSFPSVTYIKSPSNIGFGPGNNLGAKYANGDILFFLNADTLFKNNVLTVLREFFHKHAKAGFVSPILLDNSEIPYALQGTKILTPLRGLFVLTILNKIFPRNAISIDYWQSNWQKDTLRKIDVIPGTAMMVRKSVFEKIGTFDEKFFIYFEEHDICKRAVEKGYQNYIVPSAKLYHEWGVSTTDKKKFNKHFAESRFYYFKKHYGMVQACSISLLANIGKNELIAICIGLVAIIAIALFFDYI